MKKLLLTLLSSVGLCFALFAQSEYTKAADEALKNLDLSGVNSGILYDRVFPAAQLNTFTASDTSNYGHFIQAHAELYDASYAKNLHLKPEQLKGLIKESHRNGIIPVGILASAFHKLNFDALEDDGSGHYRVKAGWSGSIYETRQVSMAALLTPTVRESPIRIELPWWSTLTLNGAKVSQVQIQVASNTRTLIPGGASELLFFNEPGEFLAQYTINLSDDSSFHKVTKK